jgi:hypothetical protein
MTTFDQSSTNTGPPSMPTGTSGPRPIGFWPTIGWVGAAAVAGIVFALAWLGTYRLIFGALPNDAKVEENLTFCVYVVLVVVLIEIVRHAGWSVKSYFALTIPTWRQAAIAVAVGGAFIVIDNVVGALDPAPFDSTDYFEYNKVLAEGLLPIFWFNTVFAAAVVEEMVFRGFIYRGWSQTQLGSFWTIVLTAVLFGFGHFQNDPVAVGSITISGLLLGWLRWWSGSLVAPILAHAANNALVTIIVASLD